MGNPGPGEEDKLYPIAVLIDELKNDSVAVRTAATKRLKVIAEALGFQRTRDELIPFITEAGGGWDDEDEVLIAVAEQFGDFLDFVGGPEYASTLLAPLEQLAQMEETQVRDKAVQAIQNIISVLPDAAVERTLAPQGLLSRMGTHDWATSRASATLLLPGLYSRARPQQQQALRDLWKELCENYEPMVKRAAVTAMTSLVRSIRDSAVLKAAVLTPYAALAKDEQDGVRLLCVEKLADLCEQLPPEHISKFAMPLVRDAVSDTSWRVRYMLTDKFAVTAKAAGLTKTGQGLAETVQLFQKLAQDTEPEVRAASAHQIAKLAPHFSGGTHDAMKLLPAAQKLCSDASQQVRAAAAANIVSLGKALGPHETMGALVPLLAELLKDDFAEVRLNVIGELGKVSDVVGFEELSRGLLPAVVNLALDGKWRVREAVIKEIPGLAKQMGVEVFERDLMKVVVGWMCDQVCEIRMLVAQVLCDLVKNFGDDWFRTRLFPKLQPLASKENYMHRFGLLHFFKLAAPYLTRSTIQATYPQILQSLSRDKVPNVRFNVCRAASAALPKLDSHTYNSDWRPFLESLEKDKDDDVRKMASDAMVNCP